jgi:hypothetical protein
MREGALKSSSDWAGQKAHERERLEGMQDLLRSLQQAGVLSLCRVVFGGELIMGRKLSKIAPCSLFEAAKINASASRFRSPTSRIPSLVSTS